MFKRKLEGGLYRGLFHEPSSTMKERLELDTRQVELLERYATEIAVKANGAEKDGKQWLDVGEVSTELGSFYHEVRQNKGYKKDYQFGLGTAGSAALRRLFERTDLSFNNALLEWSKNEPFALKPNSSG
jgi:hypothetical protein